MTSDRGERRNLLPIIWPDSYWTSHRLGCVVELMGSGASPPRRWIVKIAAVAALFLYGVGAVLLFFWPDGESVRVLMIDLWYVAKGLGLPAWVSPEVFSVGANVAAFVPGTFALVVLLPRVKWWLWGLVAVLVSAGIELMQMAFLESRVPEGMDVGANGLGGFLGAGLGYWALHGFDHTDGEAS